jgi:2-dehydropantoate 2-reductase
VSENLDSLLWGKLVINVGINAMAAILRVPNGIVGRTARCEPLMEKAVSEAVRVVNALNITLPYTNPLEHVKMVCQKTARNRASMLQDILKGKPTEIGVINRAIVKKGEELGIPTPYNRFLSEIIEALEATAEHRIERI